MELALNQLSCLLLDRMLNNSGALPLQVFGVKPYKAGTPHAGNMVLALKKWVRRKVFIEKSKEVSNPDGTKRTVKDFVLLDKIQDDIETTITVQLDKTYVGALREIVEHYEAIGLMPEFVEGYLPLIAQLKGEKFVECDASEKGPEKADEEKKA